MDIDIKVVRLKKYTLEINNFEKINFIEKCPPFCYFCMYQKSYDMRYSH